MTARILSGIELTATLETEMCGEAERLAAAGSPPCLAVVLVGEDPASHTYVRNKIKAAERVGIASLDKFLPDSTTQQELEGLIAELNANPAVHGILCQLPLPKGLDAWCAVPRDPWRRLLLGVPLAYFLGKEVTKKLQLTQVPAPRRKWRPPQARLKASERRKNLRGSFLYAPRKARAVKGRRILIIDDVYTTGTTLAECAKSLRAAGARQVKGLVVAATPE